MKYTLKQTDVFSKWLAGLKDKQALKAINMRLVRAAGIVKELIMTQVTDYNPFDYMETQAEINEFLQECYQDEDPQTFITALGMLAKHHGMSNIAQAAGMSRSSLYKTLSGNTEPKWTTINKLIKALGIKLTLAA